MTLKGQNVSLKKPIKNPQLLVDNLINVWFYYGFTNVPSISAICLAVPFKPAFTVQIPSILSPASNFTIKSKRLTEW